MVWVVWGIRRSGVNLSVPVTGKVFYKIDSNYCFREVFLFVYKGLINNCKRHGRITLLQVILTSLNVRGEDRGKVGM